VRDEGDDARRCIVITLSNQPTAKTSPRSKTRQILQSPQTLKTSPTFEKTRKQLGALSNKKLLSNLENLNQQERKLKVLVLLYLSEIDNRELYLPLGYSSLFDFCTMHLKYTRATAARRIRSARAAARYPEALELLLSGEINITTLSMISDIIDQDNHGEIFSKIRGRSTRQVELLVSTHKPVNIVRDTVRPICIKRRVCRSAGSFNGGDSSLSAETNPANLEGENSRNSNKISSSAETKLGNHGVRVGDRHPANCNKSSSSAETNIILEQRLKLGFTVTPEFMNKYNKIKSLLSSKHPEGINFENVFDILMTEYLEKHDPDKRHTRRNHQAKKNDRRKNNQAPAHRSRHIPPAVRDQVYTRDKGRCSFIGANGKRCNSTWDLELDHVVPFTRGGDNSPGNLRLLCRKHNMHQAENTYGREFMKNRVMSD
jgi:5-methylcytosine-specific restriction endonuclease McrA